MKKCRSAGALWLGTWCTLVLLSFQQEAFAVVAPERVFADPRVIALARAVSDGNVAEVRRMLDSRVDASVRGEKGLTLPHFALYPKSNGAAVLRLLLKAGADPVSPLENGEDVPHYAAARDNADPEFMTVLLDAGVSPNLIGGTDRNSLLHAAVSGRNDAVIALLLSRGADVNYNHPFAGTALHRALRIPDYRIATVLLDHGANPNLRNNQNPAISPTVPRMTPAELYCRFESGKRKHPTPEQIASFDAMKAAFAKRGVAFPCGI